MNIIDELYLLAGDMVCGTDQARVFKRIEVLKEAIADETASPDPEFNDRYMV